MWLAHFPLGPAIKGVSPSKYWLSVAVKKPTWCNFVVCNMCDFDLASCYPSVLDMYFEFEAHNGTPAKTDESCHVSFHAIISSCQHHSCSLLVLPVHRHVFPLRLRVLHHYELVGKCGMQAAKAKTKPAAKAKATPAKSKAAKTVTKKSANNSTASAKKAGTKAAKKTPTSKTKSAVRDLETYRLLYC